MLEVSRSVKSIAFACKFMDFAKFNNKKNTLFEKVRVLLQVNYSRALAYEYRHFISD